MWVVCVCVVYGVHVVYVGYGVTAVQSVVCVLGALCGCTSGCVALCVSWVCGVCGVCVARAVCAVCVCARVRAPHRVWCGVCGLCVGRACCACRA